MSAAAHGRGLPLGEPLVGRSSDSSEDGGGEPGGSRPDIRTTDDIELLVRAFYRDVATDDLLGPIFAAAEVDWPSHIDTLTRFWAWQLLGERGYEGNPLLAHTPVHERWPFAEAHFTRWLELFTSTIDTHFAGSGAEAAKQRAAKMASALRRLLAA